MPVQSQTLHTPSRWLDGGQCQNAPQLNSALNRPQYTSPHFFGTGTSLPNSFMAAVTRSGVQ
jgi:hypothetical protein